MASDPTCIFCRIVAGEIPSAKLLETDMVLVIRDIGPQAPTHALVIPKRHVTSLHELDDDVLAAALLNAARSVAEQEGLTANGYRVATNVGEWGGQSVFHLHLHVLGGRPLGALG